MPRQLKDNLLHHGRASLEILLIGLITRHVLRFVSFLC